MLLELAVIPLVLLIFKITPDRKLAATQAGTLFVGLPLLLILREVLKFKSKDWIWFLGHAQFLVFFAFPILGLRLMNWDADFNTLSILGVSGQNLHRWSNISFMAMMASTVWAYWSLRKASIRK